MDQKYLLVFVTTSSIEEGRKIAQALVSEKLAACVNILAGVSSIYTWDAEICEDDEVLLLIKTRSDLFDTLCATVQKNHAYDVPEVIATNIQTGAESYLIWINEVTKKL